MSAKPPLRVGEVLGHDDDVGHRFLNGFFDSHYGEVRVEAIGWDWVVVRGSDGIAHFDEFDDGEAMENALADLRR